MTAKKSPVNRPDSNPATGPAGAAPAAAGVFELVRTFNAPRALVFEAWTQAAHLKNWWGPKGMELFACENDPRPGGVFLYGLRTPDGHEMWGKWIYRKIQPPDLIEVLICFCDAQGNPVRHPMVTAWPLTILSTTTFSEQGGKTRLMVRWQPIDAKPEEQAQFDASLESMRGGFGGVFEKLDAYLARIQQ